jgi:Protein of unknown function (DUF3551)
MPNSDMTASLHICAIDRRNFIRRCEPAHIELARLVPRSIGGLQRGREKCVPSFLPSRRLRPVTAVAANEYRYCLHGDDYAGPGDCGFTSYQQCQATASGRTAYCEVNPYLANAAVLTIHHKPHRH